MLFHEIKLKKPYYKWQKASKNYTNTDISVEIQLIKHYYYDYFFNDTLNNYFLYSLKNVANNATKLYEGSIVVDMIINEEKRMQEKLSN